MKKAFAKKALKLFWFPVKDIKISEDFKNPKFPKNVLGFSNYTQRFYPPYYLDVDNPSGYLSRSGAGDNFLFFSFSVLAYLWKNLAFEGSERSGSL